MVIPFLGRIDSEPRAVVRTVGRFGSLTSVTTSIWGIRWEGHDRETGRAGRDARPCNGERGRHRTIGRRRGAAAAPGRARAASPRGCAVLSFRAHGALHVRVQPAGSGRLAPPGG